MKIKRPESLGTLDKYQALVFLIEKNKEQWRKCARTLNKLRRDMHPWDFVDKELQRKSAYEYITQSLQDMKLSEEIKFALKAGVSMEFGFSFST